MFGSALRQGTESKQLQQDHSRNRREDRNEHFRARNWIGLLAAFLRQPFDIPTAQPLITDAEARRIAELAGLTYELILGVLLRVFTHTDESNAQLGTLLDAALPGFRVIRRV